MPDHLFVAPDGRVVALQQFGEDDRVFVATHEDEARHWTAQARSGFAPVAAHHGYPISVEGMAEVKGEFRHPREDGMYYLGPLGQRFISCAQDFRAFLQVWNFLDQDTGQNRILGEVIWPGQETYIQAVLANPWVYSLKNRQIGYTTIAVAYDAWVLRFRSQNARVHLVSRTETLAKNSLLKPMKYGLKRLPAEMLLPVAEDTTMTYRLDAGPDDRRHAQAYPAKEPGRAETCSHLHLDEWAAMAETYPELPKDVWAAAEPTISKQGGTCHILCTGVGPIGYYADVWRKCVAGEGQFFASFIPATGARPEYTAEWLADKKRRLADDTKFMHEYPERWEDALSGGTGLRFPSAHIDAAAQDASPCVLGPQQYVDGRGNLRTRRYVKVWDIAGPGEHSDATVGLVLDITEPVWDIVHFIYNRGEEYPTTATRIINLHRLFPGPTVIEDNEAGKAVRAFLGLPEDEVHGWTTTRQSKPVLISELAVALGLQTLKWNPDEMRKLDAEFRGYQLPDDNIEQDCVMACGIGVAWTLQNPQHTQGSRVMTEAITHV